MLNHKTSKLLIYIYILYIFIYKLYLYYSYIHFYIQIKPLYNIKNSIIIYTLVILITQNNIHIVHGVY